MEMPVGQVNLQAACLTRQIMFCNLCCTLGVYFVVVTLSDIFLPFQGAGMILSLESSLHPKVKHRFKG